MKRPTAKTVKFSMLALSLIGFIAAGRAQASYIITVNQVGSNVVASGSGSLKIAGLTVFLSDFGEGAPHLFGDATGSALFLGTSGSADVYTATLSGPSSFLTGAVNVLGTSPTGLIAGIDAEATFIRLWVPTGYVSGSSISESGTWAGQTLSSLDLTPGTYTWTWGTGASADSFEIQVGSVAAPEPASLTLLGLGLAGLGLIRRKFRTFA
jgi:hypothetical protein